MHLRRWSERLALGAVAALALTVPGPTRAQTTSVGGRLILPVDELEKGDNELDDLKAGLLSSGGERARAMTRAQQDGVARTTAVGTPISWGGRGDHGRSDDVRNTQVNDPALDHIQTFPGTRPFEFSIESETSLVNLGRDQIVGYNSSAGANVELIPGVGLAYTQLFFSAFSVSHDGGKSWKSGFLPPASPDSPFTFGDPSLAVDRKGNVYYASLGTDPLGNTSVNVNISTDQGDTWSAAVVVDVDEGSDKEWLAVGPDPTNFRRDNLYLAWTRFNDVGGSAIFFSKSIDGGAHWTPARAIFSPVDDGLNSAQTSFANPVVDPLTGRLYIPFLHFSNFDADNVRMLVSDDAGETFHFVQFNVPGAFDANAFPNVTPGTLNDCDGGGIRLVLHQGPSLFPGRFGTAGYRQATRLISQPSTAVFGGRVLIALNTSTSGTFGEGTGSYIRVLYSKDGGKTWADPVVVAPATKKDPQHVHPSLTLSGFAKAYVGYYTQQSDERLRTDIAKLEINGDKVKVKQSGLSSVAFDLTPSNILLSLSPLSTTNYDRAVQRCYDIGEYMSVDAGGFFNFGPPTAAWGDNRRTWTGPPGSAAPYTHAQPDVFFGRADD